MRANRSQVYSYVLHVVLDNATIQGLRKSFSLRDTEPEKYHVSEQEAYRVLKDLSMSGLICRADGHPRKWTMSKTGREHIGKIPYEQKYIAARKIISALFQELVLKFAISDVTKKRVYEAFGFSSSEVLTFEQLYSGKENSDIATPEKPVLEERKFEG